MTPDSKQTIDPPEGWYAQSPFGVLKTNTGVCLVRLEDVHAWLMQRDAMPSASAVARVFGAFAADTNSAVGMEHGAEKVRESLHFLDLSDYAEPLRGFAGRHFLRQVAELIPYVPHHRFDRGTPGALMYALGLMAGEVWAPHSVEIDLNDRLEGYCAEGYFPSVVKAREILGRFAVPFAAAHALWGWGTVPAVGSVAAAEPATVAPPDPLATLDAELRKAFEDVCKRRASSKGQNNGARESWPDADVEIVRNVRVALGRTGAKAIAPLLGMKEDSVRDLLDRKQKKKKATEAPTPTANNPFPQVVKVQAV